MNFLKKPFPLALLLALIITVQSRVTAQEISFFDDTFRVMTYNVWDGFGWGGKDTTRREQWRRWVKSKTPDIVALNELCGYNDQMLSEDARSWGHYHSVLLKESGYSVGLTSSGPIEVVERIVEDMHHGALHCRTEGFDVIVVHLSPHSADKRREEAYILLDKVRQINEKKADVIVLGDFNCLSPEDKEFYTAEWLQGRNDNGEGSFEAVEILLGAPMADAVAKFLEPGRIARGTFPTQALRKENQTARQMEARRVRIDQILVSPKLMRYVVNARVENGSDTDFLSDHYPVTIDFDLPVVVAVGDDD